MLLLLLLVLSIDLSNDYFVSFWERGIDIYVSFIMCLRLFNFIKVSCMWFYCFYFSIMIWIFRYSDRLKFKELIWLRV